MTVREMIDDLTLITNRIKNYNEILDEKLDEIEDGRQVDCFRALTYSINRDLKLLELYAAKIYKVTNENINEKK